MARITNLLFLVMLAVIVAACGGGGAKNESSPTPAEIANARRNRYPAPGDVDARAHRDLVSVPDV